MEKDIQFQKGTIVVKKSELNDNGISCKRYTIIDTEQHPRQGRYYRKPFDCAIEGEDGVEYAYTCDLFVFNEEMSEVAGKLKWNVAEYGVRQENGYFGSYSLVNVNGKQGIVYVNDRDARVEIITQFHDRIYYGKEGEVWDGDYRWNSDKPLVIFDEGKGFNIIKPHSNRLLCQEYLIALQTKWSRNGQLIGVNLNGENVIVTTNGTIVPMEETLNLDEELERVKRFTNDEILNEWIEKGKQCCYIHGLEYKGAKPCKIGVDKAKELFKTHHSFDCWFQSAEWRIIDSRVTLLFRDYANSDYD